MTDWDELEKNMKIVMEITNNRITTVSMDTIEKQIAKMISDNQMLIYANTAAISILNAKVNLIAGKLGIIGTSDS